jgi:arylsulfatase A-like enzyme
MNRRDFLKSSGYALAALPFLSCQTVSTGRQRPNILFAIADDASYPHMGAYGCDWVKTPAFDRVAHDGLLFTRAYTPNAKCAPSRSCILTGRNSWQLEQAANHWCYFPQKFQTYAETLAAHGYHVGHTAKGWAPGVAEDTDGNPRHLAGTPYNARTLDPPADHISNTDYAGNFEDFLNDRSGDEPFCFWYGGREPHRRYEYRAGLTKGGKDLTDVDTVPDFWPDTEIVRTDMLDYAYEIDYFDSHLQQMLDLLEARGELENTLVVVTADNGMPFPRIKGQEYEYSNHLPLAIMWADGIVNPGRVVDDFVSFIDFAPTFLELAVVDPDGSGMQPIQGRSLTDIFSSGDAGVTQPDRDHVLIGKERHDIGRPHDWGYPIRGIVTGDYLYLRNFEPNRWPAGNPETGYLNTDGSPTKTVVLDARLYEDLPAYWEWNMGKRPPEELYNIALDPGCMENLAADPQYAEQKTALADQMTRELEAQDDPRIQGNGEVFDQYLYADTNNQNFYERYTEGEDLPTGWVNDSDFEPNFPERDPVYNRNQISED